jgi:hypothetical protein
MAHGDRLSDWREITTDCIGYCCRCYRPLVAGSSCARYQGRRASRGIETLLCAKCWEQARVTDAAIRAEKRARARRRAGARGKEHRMVTVTHDVEMRLERRTERAAEAFRQAREDRRHMLTDERVRRAFRRWQQMHADN